MNLTLPECVGCGACCSRGPYWVEVTVDDAVRLHDLSLFGEGDIEPFAMRVKPDGSCVALKGTIGKDASCAVYASRPEVCRRVQRGSPLCLYSLGWHRFHII